MPGLNWSEYRADGYFGGEFLLGRTGCGESRRKATTGAEARMGVELYAALKRRSSTVLPASVTSFPDAKVDSQGQRSIGVDSLCRSGFPSRPTLSGSSSTAGSRNRT